MWFPEAQVRIWLYTPPADLRKAYDGLAGLVKQQLHEDPLSGQLFVFLNRRKTQMKVLYFDRSGYCLWSKRLARGQFHAGRTEGVKRGLEWTELRLIIEGIDMRALKRFSRYQRPVPPAITVK